MVTSIVPLFGQMSRRLVRDKGFAIAFVLVLAIGVGLNGAIFSALDSYALRPLPYPQAGRLLTVRENFTAYGWRMPPPAFDMATTKGVVAAGRYQPEIVTLEIGEHTRTEHVTRANHGFFSTLDVKPLYGRWLALTRSGLPPPREIVLSYPFWQSAFSGAKSAMGKSLEVDGQPYTVVGVMPPSFGFPQRDEAGWLSFKTNPVTPDHPLKLNNSEVLIRLTPGADMTGVDTVLNTRQKRYLNQANNEQRNEATSEGWKLVSYRLNAYFGADTAKNLLRMQLGATLLLILCIVSLLGLATNRHLGRQRELAMRVTLGATRRDVFLLTAVETLILGATASLLSVLIALFGQRLFGLSDVGSSQTPFTVAMTAREFILIPLATFAVTAVTLLAPLPVLRWKALMTHLREAGGEELHAPKWVQLTRRMLSAAQIGVAVVILVLTALLGVSMLNKFQATDSVKGNHLLVATLSLSGPQYAKASARKEAWQRLKNGLSTLPGVRGVGLGNGLPFTTSLSVGAFSSQPNGTGQIPIYGQAMYGDAKLLNLLGLKLLSGRLITYKDVHASQPVALVDSYFAKALYGTVNVVGKSLYWDKSHLRIIGVVRGIKDLYRLSDMQVGGTVILPSPASPPFNTLLIGCSATTPIVRQELRRALQQILPGQAFASLRTMHEDMRDAAALNLDLLVLFAVFGLAAVIMSTASIYALITQISKQKRREYALRRALGATDERVIFEVLRSAILLWVFGGLGGVLGSLFATRALASEFYGIQVLEPWLYVVVLVLMCLLVAAAAWIPARRACKRHIAEILAS